MVDLELFLFLLRVGVERAAFAREGVFAVMMRMHEFMQEFGCFLPDGCAGVHEIVRALEEQWDGSSTGMSRTARARS